MTGEYDGLGDPKPTTLKEFLMLGCGALSFVLFLGMAIWGANQKEKRQMTACHNAVLVSVDENQRGVLAPIDNPSDEQIEAYFTVGAFYKDNGLHETALTYALTKAGKILVLNDIGDLSDVAFPYSPEVAKMFIKSEGKQLLVDVNQFQSPKAITPSEQPSRKDTKNVTSSEQHSREEFPLPEYYRKQNEANAKSGRKKQSGSAIGLGIVTHGNPTHYIGGPSPF